MFFTKNSVHGAAAVGNVNVVVVNVVVVNVINVVVVVLLFSDSFSHSAAQ